MSTSVCACVCVCVCTHLYIYIHIPPHQRLFLMISVSCPSVRAPTARHGLKASETWTQSVSLLRKHFARVHVHVHVHVCVEREREERERICLLKIMFVVA